MTANERNAFERELEKNPFEAAALEGYKTVQAADFDRDVKALMYRVNQKKPKRNIRFMAAAATILLLVSAGVIWLQVLNQNPVQEMVETNSPEIMQEQAKKTETPAPIEKTEKVPGKSEYSSNKTEKEIGEVTTVKSPAKPELIAQETEAVPDETTLEFNDSHEIMVHQSPQVSTKKDLKINLDTTANYNLGGIKAVAQTELKTMDEVSLFRSETVLAPKHENRKPEPLTVQTAGKKMAPGVAEIDKIQTIADSEATPVAGLEHYLSYLDSTAVLPVNTEKKHEIVHLKFNVNTEGKPQDFENLNQADSVLFEKARQIILNGPEWKPKTSKGKPVISEFEIEIHFKKETK